MRSDFFAIAFPTLLIGLASGVALAQTTPTSTRPSATLTVVESAGSVRIPLTISNSGAAASAVQMVGQAFGTATAGQDYTYASSQTLTFPAGATDSQTLTIPLLDDALAEETEYFVVRLQNPANATVSSSANDILVYIRDNDTPTPPRAGNLSLSLVQSYQTAAPFAGSTQINSTAIARYDASTKRLYVANSVGGKLDSLNLANPPASMRMASLVVRQFAATDQLATSGLAAGVYVLRASDGATSKLVVR